MAYYEVKFTKVIMVTCQQIEQGMQDYVTVWRMAQIVLWKLGGYWE